MRGGGALDVDRRGVWNIPRENGRFGGKFSQFRFKVASFETMLRLKNNFNDNSLLLKMWKPICGWDLPISTPRAWVYIPIPPLFPLNKDCSY